MDASDCCACWAFSGFESFASGVGLWVIVKDTWLAAYCCFIQETCATARVEGLVANYAFLFVPRKGQQVTCLHAGWVMPVLFLMLQQCQIVSCVRWVMSHSSCHIEVEQPCWLRLCFSHHWLTARLPKSSRGLSTKAGFLSLRLVLARFCWVEASALDFFVLLLTMAHGTGCTCKSEEPSEGEQSDHEPRGIRSQVIGERT